MSGDPLNEEVVDVPPAWWRTSREIRIKVTAGQDLEIDGEEAFADWELDAIYADLLHRPEADPETEPETCPNCGEVVTHNNEDDD